MRKAERVRPAALALSVSAALAALLAVGCNPFIEFDVPLEGDTEIEEGGLLEALANDVGFGDFLSIDVSGSQAFENNQVGKEQVTRATVTSVELTVTSPDDGDLDFLDEITFLVAAPGLPKVAIASQSIPDGVKSAQLAATGAELVDYVHADALEVTTEARGHRPAKATGLHAKIVLRVGALLFAPRE